MFSNNDFPNLPSGFSNLVEAVADDRSDDGLPVNKEEIWNALMYPIFLGKNVRSAQASYIKNVLSEYVTMEKAQELGEGTGWREEVLDKIGSKLMNISGDPGEGYKSGILKTVKGMVENHELSKSMHRAVNYIDSNDIDAQKIEDLRGDIEAQRELIVSSAKNIYNIGLVKSVLWFYNCGIAKHLAPPNSHVKDFLSNCNATLDIEDLKDEEIEVIGERSKFLATLTSVSEKMESVTLKVESKLNTNLTVREVQSAVWYLQTCKKLEKVKYLHTDLTPTLLLDFLEEKGWDINEFSARLNDLERLKRVGQSLRDFLQSL